MYIFDVGYLFRIIVDAHFTLPYICPALSYPCSLTFSKLNFALVSVSIIKLAIHSPLRFSNSMKKIIFSVIYLSNYP